MVKLNKWLVNGSLAAASIIGSVLYINQNKKPREINAIPPFFSGVAPYLFAHRG
ncbi:glycerophosphodiester phosphodiesterase, partial [Staphylococcus warneri]